jgi:hypothetical protein
MKLNLLETHDRYEHFTKQSTDIGSCCQNLIDKRPFGEHSFYIFAHSRTLGMDEKFKLFMSGRYKSMEEVPEKTLIWQPRLTKPKAQTNSMLFKAYPGSDVVKVLWLLPPREMWSNYAEGNIAENKTVSESIYNFENNREKMEAKEDDDLSDDAIDAIYQKISLDALTKKKKN